ncbi:MAG: fibronectin type III domain-containing protein, partial [Dolichospermum sp.]
KLVKDRANRYFAQVGNNTTGIGNVVVGASTPSAQTFTVTTCAQPTSVAATTGTVNTASINVTWNNPSAVERADVIYRLADPVVQAAPPVGAEFTRINTGQVAAGSRNYTLTGLDASKNYEVYVQVRCTGGAWSNWVATTPATTTSSSGAAATCTRPTTTAPANNSAITGSSATFSWSAVANSTAYEVFLVEVDGATPPIPVGGTAQVITTSNTNTTVYFAKTNTKYRLQVRAVCGSSFGEYSDAIYVTTGTTAAPCTAPVFNVTTGTVSNGFASRVVTWAALTNNQYVGLSYRRTPSGEWLWANQAATATNYTITGLSNGNYDIRMFNVCDNGTVLFAPIQNITVADATASCDIPTGLGHTSLSNPAGANLTWTGTTGTGTVFQVVYWLTSTPATKYYYSTSTTNLEVRSGINGGINVNSNYTYYVNVWCNGQFAGSSAIGTFTTGSATMADKNDLTTVMETLSVDKETANNLNVYPNPAKQSAVISYQSADNTKQVELTIIDALGREVYKETAQTGRLNTNLNVS